jgi:hypothetical protein
MVYGYGRMDGNLKKNRDYDIIVISVALQQLIGERTIPPKISKIDKIFGNP